MVIGFLNLASVDAKERSLVFSIFNFFITKTPLANNWRRKKIPSCSYSALTTDGRRASEILNADSETVVIFTSLLSGLEVLSLELVSSVGH